MEQELGILFWFYREAAHFRVFFRMWGCLFLRVPPFLAALKGTKRNTTISGTLKKATHTHTHMGLYFFRVAGQEGLSTGYDSQV